MTKKLGAVFTAALLACGFSGCGAAGDDTSGDTLEAENPPVGKLSAAACQAFTGSISSHVTAGRATSTRYAGGQLQCDFCSISINGCTPAPGCYYQPQRGGRVEVRCF